MKSLQLGEYGVPIVFNQALDITTADLYILYTKPSGEEGQWNAVKSGTSFYYMLQDGDIDETGTWILWLLAEWPTKTLWARVALQVRNAPTDRVIV